MSQPVRMLAWTVAPVVGSIAGVVVARAAVMAAAGMVVVKLSGTQPGTPTNQAREGR